LRRPWRRSICARFASFCDRIGSRRGSPTERKWRRALINIYICSALLNVCPARLYNTPLAMHLLLLKRLKATFLFASETPQRRRRPISCTRMFEAQIFAARATKVAAARKLMRAFCLPSGMRFRHSAPSSSANHRATQKIISRVESKERNSGVEHRTRLKRVQSGVIRCYLHQESSSRPDRDFLGARTNRGDNPYRIFDTWLRPLSRDQSLLSRSQQQRR
jgi:hypothetical protein